MEKQHVRAKDIGFWFMNMCGMFGINRWKHVFTCFFFKIFKSMFEEQTTVITL